MKYILKLNELVHKLEKRIKSDSWPFIFLMIAAVAQLALDVLLWKETRRLDYSATMLLTGLVLAIFYLFLVWQASEYRHRTVVAILMIANTACDTIFAIVGIPVVRGLLIPIDVLWILGLIALRYENPDRKLFRPFTVREM